MAQKAEHEFAGVNCGAGALVRFTFSKSIDAGPCPGHIELLTWMADAADQFAPITEQEDAQLKAWSQDLDVIFPQDD